MLTNEIIGALWRVACGTGVADVDIDLMHTCTVAINGSNDFGAGEQAEARARIVKILDRCAPLVMAETVTDEQIRELRNAVAREDPDDDATPTYCHLALMAPATSQRRGKARGICADVINARTVKEAR